MHCIDKVLNSARAVFRMQSLDPILMRIVCVRRQSVDGPILGRPGLISKAVPKINRYHSYLGYLLAAGYFAAASRQRPFRTREHFDWTTKLFFSASLVACFASR